MYDLDNFDAFDRDAEIQQEKQDAKQTKHQIMRWLESNRRDWSKPENVAWLIKKFGLHRKLERLDNDIVKVHYFAGGPESEVLVMTCHESMESVEKVTDALQ